MSNKNHLNYKEGKFLNFGMIILLIIVNLVYASYFIRDAFPSHNMISNLVMAAAPIHGMGLPYKDYWDIYPPGIFMFLTPFEFFFHGQTIVFKIVHILFSIIIGLIVLKFLRHLFRNYSFSVLSITLFFLLYLLMSNYYYCILFHNAFLALFLSVCGLYFLMFSKRTWLKYLLSSLLFAFSASMKETFLFTAFLPLLYVSSRYLLREKKSGKLFIKNSALVIIGILVVLLGNYLYLNFLGIISYYKEVSTYKSQLIKGNSFIDLFNNLNPFNFHDFSLRFKELSDVFFRRSFGLLYCLFLFILVALVIAFNVKKEDGKRKFYWKSWTHQRGIGIILLGFFLTHFEGFKLLNKYQPNYTLQMVPSLVLAFAFLFYISNNYLQWFLRKKMVDKSLAFKRGMTFMFAFCFAFSLIPRFNNFNFFSHMSFHQYMDGFSLKKPEVVLPGKVKQAMGDDRRVFYIYGWGTPYFYYFANVRPFSRFFILHPSILGEEQIRELVEQFKIELPKVVLYNNNGADMNTLEFENNSVQFKKLLEKCYEFYPADMYSGLHCTGYYLLKSNKYFKMHTSEFIAAKYL